VLAVKPWSSIEKHAFIDEQKSEWNNASSWIHRVTKMSRPSLALPTSEIEKWTDPE
jgi:hypothetical protein